jgi:hypothetical protein
MLHSTVLPLREALMMSSASGAAVGLEGLRADGE